MGKQGCRCDAAVGLEQMIGRYKQLERWTRELAICVVTGANKDKLRVDPWVQGMAEVPRLLDPPVEIRAPRRKTIGWSKPDYSERP